jgi:hypothetical protein
MQNTQQQNFTRLLVKYLDRVPQTGIQENQEMGDILVTVQSLQRGELLLTPPPTPPDDKKDGSKEPDPPGDE